MSFIKYNNRVLGEVGILETFPDEDTVSSVLNLGELRVSLVVESDCVTNLASKATPSFV